MTAFSLGKNRRGRLPNLPVGIVNYYHSVVLTLLKDTEPVWPRELLPLANELIKADLQKYASGLNRRIDDNNSLEEFLIEFPHYREWKERKLYHVLSELQIVGKVTKEEGPRGSYYKTPSGVKRQIGGTFEAKMRVPKVDLKRLSRKEIFKDDFKYITSAPARNFFASLSSDDHVIESEFLKSHGRLAVNLILDVDSSRMLRDLANESWEGNTDKMMLEFITRGISSEWFSK